MVASCCLSVDAVCVVAEGQSINLHVYLIKCHNRSVVGCCRLGSLVYYELAFSLFT